MMEMPLNYFFSFNKLVIQTIIRVIFIILIFLIDLLSNKQSEYSLPFKSSFILLTIFVSIFYLFLLNRYKNKKILIYIQIVLDLSFTTGLLFIIESTSFLNIFLYLLSIINSTIILLRIGAIISASLSSILTSVVYYVKQNDVFSDFVLNLDFIKAVAPNIVAYISVYFSFAVIVTLFIEQLDKQNRTIIENEKEIEKQKKLKQIMIDSIESGMIALDKEGLILYINKTGQKILSIYYKDYLSKHIKFLFENIDLNDTNDSNERIEIRYNELFIDYTINNLNDPDKENNGYIIIFYDVTEIKKQKEIAKRNEQFAYIGQLAAYIAHEIRNPLAAMSGSFQMIKKIINNTNSTVERLATIGDKEINRLNVLITEFLDYTKIDNLTYSVANVGELLKEIISFNEFVVQIDERLLNINIKCDKDKINQIFLNLIKNSCDATELKDAGFVKIYLIENKKYYSIIIEDNGCGIEKDNLKRIFEPFFTTKQKGTGLGLAIVHKIITSHKGTIEVESTENVGTKFILNFLKENND